MQIDVRGCQVYVLSRGVVPCAKMSMKCRCRRRRTRSLQLTPGRFSPVKKVCLFELEGPHRCPLAVVGV